MNKEQKDVLEFHKTFGIPVSSVPTIPMADVTIRRNTLIAEEANELAQALSKGDLVEVADGIADLLYVVYGTAIECGLDMEPIFNEIHRSNMTKKGGHFNSIGKLIKPDTYEAPKLIPIIAAQITK